MTGRTRILTTGLVALTTLGATTASADAATIVSASQNAQTQVQTQQGRLAPDGVSSQCNPTGFKLEPSLANPGSNFTYVNHTFRSSLTNPVCITVDIDTMCGSLFSVAYSPSFTPADPLANYAADMGQIAGSPVYSFMVTGGSSFGVVVHETTTTPSCGAYQLTASSSGPWANSLPAIVGTGAVGTVLTGNNAVWVTAPTTPTVQRRWRRCDAAGANCSDIPGATGATYTVTDADLGRTLRFRNDATDAQGTNTSDSAFVEPFIPFETHAAESLGAGDRVQNGVFVRGTESRCGVPTTAPTILQATSSFLYDTFPVTSLLNEPACLGVRTLAACGNGVSPSIYNPSFAPALGLAANYAAHSGVSFNAPAAVSTILPASGARDVTVYQGNSAGSCPSYSVTLGADAPFATVRPALSGTAATGSALTASNGTWSGSPAFAQSWRRCDAAGNACAPIPGATGASYAPTNADVGKRLRARVTATRGRSVSSDSPPSAIVLDRTGPVGRLRLGSRNLRKAVKSGRIPVRVGCDEACAVTIQLRVTKKLAKKLKLKKKLVIARTKGTVRAGRAKTLRAKLTKAARRALRSKKSLKLTIRATLTDSAGNPTKPARRASLKRPKKPPR